MSWLVAAAVAVVVDLMSRDGAGSRRVQVKKR